MLTATGITTKEVLSTFTDEISNHDGEILDSICKSDRLITRSVLPQFEEVRIKDTIRAGVALKATLEGIWIYPYTFRLVCRNGAIIARTLDVRQLEEIESRKRAEVLQSVREVAAACCSRKAFGENIDLMRVGCDVEADVELMLLVFESSARSPRFREATARAERMFHRADDRSWFGLANALTAVARDIEAVGSGRAGRNDRHRLHSRVSGRRGRPGGGR